MDMECDVITKLILPAVRIGMAERMRGKYRMTQSDIASRLGVAQVAVSKYLNGRYSNAVKSAKDRIIAQGLLDKVAESASRTADPRAVDEMVSDLCARIASTNLVN